MLIYQTPVQIDFVAESVQEALDGANAYLGQFYLVPSQARAVAAMLKPGVDTFEDF